MAAPAFTLDEFDGTASGTINVIVDEAVTLHIDLDDVGFSWGTDGAYNKSLIVWYWDDVSVSTRYSQHLGGFVSGHAYTTTGTKTVWCAIVNGSSRQAVLEAVNAGNDCESAVDAAVTAGNATKVTRTISVSASSRTEYWVDGAGSGSADGSSEANAAASIPSTLTTEYHYIVTADTAVTGTITTAANCTIECRNGAALIWTSNPTRCINWMSGGISKNVTTRVAITSSVLGPIHNQLASEQIGLSMISPVMEGQMGYGLFYNVPSGSSSTIVGSVVVYSGRVYSYSSQVIIWAGNGNFDATDETDPLNDRGLVLFDWQSRYGSHDEYDFRGFSRYVTMIDCDWRRVYCEIEDANWDESTMQLYTQSLVDVELGQNSYYIVNLDAGTGITTGEYLVTAKGTHAGSGLPALTLSTSPSTGNIDLNNNDIQAMPSGWKGILRLSAGRYRWVRNCSFEISNQGAAPISGSYGNTVITYSPGSDPAGFDQDTDVFERCLLLGGNVTKDSTETPRNITFRACVCDRTVVRSDGVHIAEDKGDQVYFRDFIAINQTGGPATAWEWIHCTYLTSWNWGSAFDLDDASGCTILNNLCINPAWEVTSNDSTNVWTHIRTAFSVDNGATELALVAGNQFSPDQGAGAFTQSGGKFFNFGGGWETVATMNARAFCSGEDNTVTLGVIDASYLPASNVNTVTADDRCFEDYNGNYLSGTVYVGAVNAEAPNLIARDPIGSVKRRSIVACLLS